MPVNAVGGGVPYFCASPTATAVADGPWSSPATWSNQAVPAAGAKVLIPAGRQVVYDVASGNTIQCVEIRGRMALPVDALGLRQLHPGADHGAVAYFDRHRVQEVSIVEYDFRTSSSSLL